MFTEKGNIWVERERNVCGGLEGVLCVEGIVGVCVYGVCVCVERGVAKECSKEGVASEGCGK